MPAALLFALLLSQVPCVPSDGTVVCQCKQGVASACEALAEANPELAKKLLQAVAMAKAAEASKKAADQASASVDTGCGQPPDDDDKKCTGQNHHVISKTVWRVLDRHETLKGLYRYRDPRFETRAKDLKAHCGWERWHRRVDEEIATWLTENRRATSQQFEAFLRELYSRPELRARFPNGI